MDESTARLEIESAFRTLRDFVERHPEYAHYCVAINGLIRNQSHGTFDAARLRAGIQKVRMDMDLVQEYRAHMLEVERKDGLDSQIYLMLRDRFARAVYDLAAATGELIGIRLQVVAEMNLAADQAPELKQESGWDRGL